MLNYIKKNLFKIPHWFSKQIIRSSNKTFFSLFKLLFYILVKVSKNAEELFDYSKLTVFGKSKQGVVGMKFLSIWYKITKPPLTLISWLVDSHSWSRNSQIKNIN